MLIGNMLPAVFDLRWNEPADVGLPAWTVPTCSVIRIILCPGQVVPVGRGTLPGMYIKPIASYSGLCWAQMKDAGVEAA